MTLTALRDDALASSDEGFALRLGLPWIRSLPLAALEDLTISVDGESAAGLTVHLEGRDVEAAALAHEDAWWFLQDRLTVLGDLALSPGAHDVAVTFRLVIPYLQTGPDGPLALPFHLRRSLTLDAAASTGERPSGAPRAEGETKRGGDLPLPADWTLAASAFNWTPDVILADRDAPDIAVGIVTSGVASVIELEPGQLWRSFPEPADTEVDAFRDALSAAGGSVSIVGASLDDWLSPTRKRDDAERLAFLLPQLQAAHRVGAKGLRLPIGQAGEPLLRQVLPVLHDLDLVLFEEIQGQQTPDAPGSASALETIARIDDPRLRVLLDISMLMPSLPPSYLELLREGGVPAELLTRLANEWSDPAINGAVIDLLRSGEVPPSVHTAYMNLLVRFGRSRASELRGILPLVGAVHLKFWDLDDAGGRVSQPMTDIAAELAAVGFAGTLCSEWGGHEWIDADAGEMTRAHLELARTALSAGAALPLRQI